MLVGIPIGLWTFAFVCDLIHAFGSTALWSTVARDLGLGGIGRVDAFSNWLVPVAPERVFERGLSPTIRQITFDATDVTSSSW